MPPAARTVSGPLPTTCRICTEVRAIEALLEDRGASLPDSIRVLAQGTLAEVRRLLQREPGRNYVYAPRQLCAGAAPR